MSSLLVLALTIVTTVAGVPGSPGAGDGPVTIATFDRPTWLDVVPANGSNGKAGDVIVVDRANRKVRVISAGNVRTPVFQYSWANPTPYPLEFGGPFGGGVAIEPPGSGCGASQYDSGFWISSTGSRDVAILSMSGLPAARDDVAPIIGLGGELNMPTGLALSKPYAGGLSDIGRRRLFIADSGDHVIRRVRFVLSFEACPQHKILETHAGTRGVAGWQDGPGATARFNAPRGIATAADGSVYVADSGNHVIRRIDANGDVTTIAGEPGVAGSDEWHLNTPSGIEVRADGAIFIADTGNHAIRMIGTDGELITIAGRPGVPGFADGTDARFAGPVGLKLGPDGSLYVADTSNHAVRKIELVEVEPRRRAVRR